MLDQITHIENFRVAQPKMMPRELGPTLEQSVTGMGQGSGKPHRVRSPTNRPTDTNLKASAWLLFQFFEVAGE